MRTPRPSFSLGPIAALGFLLLLLVSGCQSRIDTSSGNGGDPACLVQGQNLEFGTVMADGAAWVDRTFTLRNIGGGLLGGRLEAPGGQPFTLVRGGGTYSLGPGALRSVTVRFRTDTPGHYSAFLNIGHGCRGVTLVGTALPVTSCLVRPANLDFGTIGTDGAFVDRRFAILNIGRGPLSGTVRAGCDAYRLLTGGGAYTLAPGESLAVTVRFQPAAVGNQECLVETGQDACGDVICTGLAENPPLCVATPAAFEFGGVALGTVAEKSGVIENLGGGRLVGTLAATGADYSLTAGAGAFDLGPGDTHPYSVRFAPSALGDRPGTLTTGLPGCATLALSGSGQAAPACQVTPAGLDFGPVTLFAPVTKSFTLKNVGGGTLGGTISETCDDFAVTAGGGAYSLAAGETRVVTVEFNPATLGTRSCTIELGPAGCGTLTCTGLGDNAPSCALSTEALDFEAVALGASRDLPLTLTNAGGGRLSGHVAATTTEFAVIAGGGDFELGAGQARNITVRFAPAALGARQATLEVGGGCAPVALAGVGEAAPVCRVTPALLDFGGVALNATVTKSLELRNDGGGTLSGVVALACPGFTLVSGGGAFSLVGGATRTVTISFRPTAAGPATCSLDTGAPACGAITLSGTGEAPPLCQVTPTALDFGTVTVGSLAEKSFTLTNAGGGQISGSVTEACPEFSVVLGGGAYTLGAGESRTVTVRFQPTGVGARNCGVGTGALDCANVGCTGQGQAASACRVSPQSLDFGAVTLGAPAVERTFSITNTGGGTLSGTVALGGCAPFSLSAGAGAYSLGPGQSRTVTVRFLPTALGPAACTVETGDGACADVALSGSGQAAAVCQLSTTSLDFGGVGAGGFQDRSFTITNTGGGTLAGTVGEACNDFALVSGGGAYALAGGQARTVVVRFQPTTVGARSCPIDLGLPAGAGCGPVTATGQGEAPPLCQLSPATLDFGEVTAGSSAERTFTLTNQGGGTLSGTVGVACPEFSLVGAGGYALTGGQSATFTLRFAPVGTGVRNCTVDTGSGACADLSVSGVGQDAPQCALDPTALDFGAAGVGGGFVDRVVTLTNAGGGTLSGVVATAPGCADFSVLSGGGAFALAAGQARPITVRFQPQATGARACTLQFGTGLCAGLPLSGSGVTTPVCLVTPAALDFGLVTLNTTAQRSFTLTNTGGGTLSGVIAVNCPEFGLVSGGGAYSLTAGQSVTVNVKLTPTSAGAKSCVLTTGQPLCGDVPATGTGSPPAVCQLSATNLDFGGVIGGQSKDLSFTISNTGGSVLTGSVGETCGNYSIISGAGSFQLFGGQSRNVTVRFSPVTFGPSSCVIATGAACGTVSAGGTGLVSWLTHVRPLIVRDCTTCHDGVSATNLTDYNVAVLDVFPGSPADSPLLVKPAGQTNHDPGLVPGWEIGSDIYNIVLIWIQQGALNN